MEKQEGEYKWVELMSSTVLKAEKEKVTPMLQRYSDSYV